MASRQIGPAWRMPVLLWLGGMLAFLAACEQSGSLSTPGFQSNYLVARQALETGNYALAIRRYEGLLRDAGPAEQRLRLEYAHSLLRANRFEDAVREADLIVANAIGPERAAALAVRGTARHEAARLLLSQGQRDADTIALLYRAAEDLRTFTEAHADLDAAGMMAERSRMATAELQRLGG